MLKRIFNKIFKLNHYNKLHYNKLEIGAYTLYFYDRFLEIEAETINSEVVRYSLLVKHIKKGTIYK